MAGGSELFELVRALLEKEERERKERALAARMRMAKEAVRHGRGRASRTALAGGVRGELGHGLVCVCGCFGRGKELAANKLVQRNLARF